MIPKHTCYVEPFGGGLALLLAKERSDIEVINDINGDLVNFYRCVRFHQEPLLTELEFVLNSRKEFLDFRSQPGLTDIQRAARWFYRNKNGFAGSIESFGFSATSSGGSSQGSRARRMELIRDLNYRLDRVTIENLSWEKLIDYYDRPTTFFFIDPPYLGGSHAAYGSWTITDARKLKDRLARLKGRWILTFNDSKTIRQLFAGCRFKSVERQRGINNRNGSSVRYKELIIRR